MIEKSEKIIWYSDEFLVLLKPIPLWYRPIITLVGLKYHFVDFEDLLSVSVFAF